MTDTTTPQSRVRRSTGWPAEPVQQAPWPAGTTARIVTRAGMFWRNPNATVDITELASTLTGNPASHAAACRPCGWTTQPDTVRNNIVAKAQQHADQCTALPNPISDTPADVPAPAIHHSH